MIERGWLGLAGLSGAVAVAIEALARHWAGADPHRVELAGTAARYALLQQALREIATKIATSAPLVPDFATKLPRSL